MQMAVIFVPVLAGIIGFAVDLGILYAVRGELKEGAAAIALAAAQQLNGTDAASGTAPMKLNIAETPIASHRPSGNPHTARTWFSN